MLRLLTGSQGREKNEKGYWWATRLPALKIVPKEVHCLLKSTVQGLYEGLLAEEKVVTV